MITYEWVVEEMDGDEIVDTFSFDDLSEAQRFAQGSSFAVICLRRDVGNDLDDITDRQYAYAGASQFEYGAKIPVKLKAQFDTLKG